jgi:serine/threonine protein kinase
VPLKPLGKGSFGEVFLVKEKSTGTLYAMKALTKENVLGKNLIRYARTERDVLSYTRCPFIVDLHCAF